MKKTRKILSFLLAVVMVFSGMSLSLFANAALKPEGLLVTPETNFVQSYVTDNGNANGINATVLFDYLDNVVLKENEKTVIDLKLTKITIDLTSVDGILGTLDLVKSVSNVLKKIGSLSKLNTNNWTSGQKRSKTGDYQILMNLISFLYDNRVLVQEVVSGSFKLGEVGVWPLKVNVDDLVKSSTGIDTSNIMGYLLKGKAESAGIYGFIKDTVAKLFYNYEEDPSLTAKYNAAYAKKLDNMLLEDGLGNVLNNFLAGLDEKIIAYYNEPDAQPSETPTLKDVLKSLYGYGFKLEGMLDTYKYDSSKSLDATIAQIADIIYSKNVTYIKSLANDYGAVLGTFVASTKFGAPFADVLNFNPVDKTCFDFTNTDNSITGLNKFIGKVLGGIIPTYTGWNNNVNLGKNIQNLAMWAIDYAKAKGGEDNPYVAITFTKGDFSTYAMSLAKIIVEALGAEKSVIDSLNSCKNTEEVVVKFLPSLLNKAEEKVIGTNSKTVDAVLGDLLGSFISKYTVLYTDNANTKLYVPLSGTSYVNVLNYAANRYLVDLNLDAIFGLNLTKSQSVWQKLNAFQEVLFKGTETMEYVTAEKLLPSVVKNLMNLNLEALVDECVEKAFTNLNKTVTAAQLVYNMLNNAFYHVLGVKVFNVNVKTDKTPLDSAVQNAALGTSVNNIITGFNSKKAQIIPVVLYLFITLSDQAIFEYKYNSGKATYTVDMVLSADGKAYSRRALTKGTHFNVTYANDKAYLNGIGNFASKISNTHKHTVIKDKAVSATASKDGKTEGSHCKVCGTVIKAQAKIAKAVVKLSKTSVTYNGKAQKPSVSVKDSSGKTISTSNYTVKWSGDCKNAGVYTATVTFKGSYSGTVKLTFSVLPGAIKTVKASVKDTTATITWSKSAGAKSYNVYVSTNGKKWSKVGSTTKTTITAKKLKAGTKYYFKVEAVAGKATTQSKSISAVTLTSAPSIKVTSTKKATATVTYKKVAGAKSYVIYTSTDGKKFKKATSTTKTSVTLQKLSAGKKIYVKVAAVNSAKKEALSKAASVTVKKK